MDILQLIYAFKTGVLNLARTPKLLAGEFLKLAGEIFSKNHYNGSDIFWKNHYEIFQKNLNCGEKCSKYHYAKTNFQ